MNSSVFFNHLDYYIPTTKLFFDEHLSFFQNDNDSIYDEGEKFLEFSEEMLNLKSVSIEKTLSLEDMALALIQKNIDNSKIIPEKIDYIFIAVDFNDHLISFGHFIQHHFKMEKANVIRVADNFCANVDTAIGLAKRILKHEDKNKQILLITGCKLEDSLKNRILGSYGVMGDSVGIALMSCDESDALAEIKAQEVVTKGVLHEVDFTKDNTILHYQTFAECVKKIIDNNNIIISDLRKVLMHNANHLLIETVIKSFGIDSAIIEKQNFGKFGHLGTTDLIFNLNTFIENSNCTNGNVLAIQSGATGTYAATYFITSPRTN